MRNDQVIGFIRRADYGFFIDMPIAYGYVLILLRTYYILCSSDEILCWKMILGAWSIFLLKNKYSMFVLILNWQHIFIHLFFMSTQLPRYLV